MFFSEQMNSTQTVSVENRTHIPGKLVLCTLNQTQGRGRRTNEWISPNDANSLTLSTVISIPMHSNLFYAVSSIELLVALAVCNAIEAVVERMKAENQENVIHLLQIGTKWPNDVFLLGRKVVEF
mmetsp:Transcript_7188/g.12946  ORF Transcript_7188/g.12946 Transcript_7188/m.12946 type:complete len:125 (+) Transcript_7188:278-652(+)